MLETPGRKSFHSPFPLGKLHQVPGPAFEGPQNSPANVSPIADIATRKNPTAPLMPSRNTPSIADLETRKNPTVPLQPSHMRNAGPQQRKRAPLSPRKKKLLIVLLIASLLPSIIIIFEIINGVLIYKQEQDGVAHLQAIQTIFHSSGSNDAGKYFDRNKLLQAQGELAAAHADFVSLSNTLDHNGSIGLASNLLSTQVSTIRALGHIAVDGTTVAQQFIKVAIKIAPTVSPALLQSSSHSENAPLKSFITPSAFEDISATFDTIKPLIHTMNIYAQQVSPDALPISEKQREMIASILPLLPVLDAALAQKSQWISVLRWFLGIDGQRAFLIEPMDSSELRATGGFTGQFGELILNGGHPGPLKLANIGKYEESHQDSPPDPTVYPKVLGQRAPAPYSNWWPIENFGLRDSNLSADFPTSAKIAMDSYNYEFGKHVDGVIIFTPMLIKQVLHVTGPITIPAYGEVITEQNLEDRLHYYQLDNKGIRREQLIEHIDDTQTVRKLFTQRVTATLMSAVTHLPANKLLAMVNEMLHSMKSKDLQIYVTNPQLEALIGKYGSTASLDRSTNHDGLFIVQSNLSASKASQYVTTSLQDTITLDSKGGATHHLLMTLDYQKKGDVYGLDTYRDYVRIYTPANSQFISGNGFDQANRPYCGDDQSNYTHCQPDVYGDGSLVCSPPIEIGPSTSYINDPAANLTDRPLDVTGPPQDQESDEAERNMFSGWVVIPKNCTMKVTLSWYVPPMSKPAYNLLLQEQASVYGSLHLTIEPATGTCLASQRSALNFSGMTNGEDKTFTIMQQGPKCSLVAR
ncbi:MAG: DUF4012 domain-containing protein [Ktedonobacteraceae bacterium]|nr:DUF4012 domain-containing protein [Ktedonobacteraceae bacterium]